MSNLTPEEFAAADADRAALRARQAFTQAVIERDEAMLAVRHAEDRIAWECALGGPDELNEANQERADALTNLDAAILVSDEKLTELTVALVQARGARNATVVMEDDK